MILIYIFFFEMMSVEKNISKTQKWKMESTFVKWTG